MQVSLLLARALRVTLIWYIGYYLVYFFVNIPRFLEEIRVYSRIRDIFAIMLLIILWPIGLLLLLGTLLFRKVKTWKK